MLLTVTLNAAIDKTYRLPRFQPGQLHRAQDVLSLPGGKGINVARVAKTLGAEVTATGFVAGHNGRMIREGCAQAGIVPDFVDTPGESRCCLTFLEQESGLVTEVLEPGPTITTDTYAALQEKIALLSQRVRIVVFSGSLPAGMPSDAYGKLIHIVRDAGATAVLDTSGEPLKLGLEANPDLIKPNCAEAEAMLGYSLDSDESRLRAIRDLQAAGARRVLLSLGEEGAWFGASGEVWQFPAIPLPGIVNPVGCGDALFAGVMTGRLLGREWTESIRLGMACAAANALSLGAGQVELSIVSSFLEQAAVTRLA